jgi:pyruvate/2-oxoglutarate dehydrogenase complex dihydrolipoamide acyltransferase (E2) component
MAVNTTIQVVMPQMGDSVTEGTILEWHKQEGDTVSADETIVEISTDKVDAEVPAPASGVVSKILAGEGDTVAVGQLLAEIATDGAAPSSNGQSAAEAAPVAAAPAAAAAAAEVAPVAEASPAAFADQATPAASATQDTPAAATAEPTDAPSGGGQIVDIVTPTAGESVTEGTILEWHVAVGGQVERDETVVEISTDKVDVELPAPKATPSPSGRSSRGYRSPPPPGTAPLTGPPKRPLRQLPARGATAGTRRRRAQRRPPLPPTRRSRPSPRARRQRRA